MSAPSSAGWTLQNIQSKVRLITGRPSTDQISQDQLTAYINDYYVYTMPFELKEQITNQFLTFTTTPGINMYSFPGGYFTDQPGAYADGYPLIFYQDPDIFYQDWPLQYAVDNIATGNGVAVTFTGGLQNPPVIIGSVTIASDDQSGSQQLLTDQNGNNVSTQIALGNGGAAYNGTLGAFPVLANTVNITNGIETFLDNGSGLLIGNLGGTGSLDYNSGIWSLTFNSVVAVGISIIATYQTTPGTGTLTGNGSGTINYLTGAYSVTFAGTPPTSAGIYAKYQGYQGNRPQGVLFFNNSFLLMPVPDQAYRIQMQGYIKPVLLSNLTDTPLQNEWGSLIAYGAALQIFADSGDMDNYDRYFDEFKRQENIALGRTIQQLTSQQSVPRF